MGRQNVSGMPCIFLVMIILLYIMCTSLRFVHAHHLLQVVNVSKICELARDVAINIEFTTQ